MVSSGERMARAFSSFDRDSDGKISAAELRLCVEATLGDGISAGDAAALVASVDADGDGLLSEEEFLKLVAEEDGGEEDQRRRGLRGAFGVYEVEGRGCITPASLRRALSRLGASRDVGDCRAMIQRFDLNGDGVLTFDEFETMMDS
ncbi:hypothetical protein ACQJBY_028120 [Aegilops geniculata]